MPAVTRLVSTGAGNSGRLSPEPGGHQGRPQLLAESEKDGMTTQSPTSTAIPPLFCVIKTVITGDIDYMFIMSQARASRVVSHLNPHSDPTHYRLGLAPFNG